MLPRDILVGLKTILEEDVYEKLSYFGERLRS
jgi:hypothetical protein